MIQHQQWCVDTLFFFCEMVQIFWFICYNFLSDVYERCWSWEHSCLAFPHPIGLLYWVQWDLNGVAMLQMTEKKKLHATPSSKYIFKHRLLWLSTFCEYVYSSPWYSTESKAIWTEKRTDWINNLGKLRKVGFATFRRRWNTSSQCRERTFLTKHNQTLCTQSTWWRIRKDSFLCFELFHSIRTLPRLLWRCRCEISSTRCSFWEVKIIIHW